MTAWLPKVHWDGAYSAGVSPRSSGSEKVARLAESAIDRIHSAYLSANDAYNSITNSSTLSPTTKLTSKSTAALDICKNPKKWQNRLLCGEKYTTITFFLVLGFVCLLFAIACWRILRVSSKTIATISEEDGLGPDHVGKLSMETQPPRYKPHQHASAFRLSKKARRTSPANAWQRIGDLDKDQVAQFDPVGWRSAMLVESRGRTARALATKLPNITMA